MRKAFFDYLYLKMKENKDIIFLTGDLGYGYVDKIKNDLPGQFINCGASEQAMVGIAVGLALKGKIPIVYSITPFVLWRPAETIRLYLDHEQIPVKLIGSGRNQDYSHDGFSHDGTGDIELMQTSFKHIKSFWPNDEETMLDIVSVMLSDESPYYLNLKR